jgi:hypothetical protein
MQRRATSARSWAERPLIWLLAEVATVCARSTFDRPPACVGDPDAGNLDLASARPHGLALRGGKAALDQVGYHINAEPMGEHRRAGAAAQPCGGKHFERQALLPAEVNPCHTNAPQRQNFLADRICHLTVYANRAVASHQLWRPTVTYMNSVKIVVASLRVSLSQVKAWFRELIETTQVFLFSRLVSKQN